MKHSKDNLAPAYVSIMKNILFLNEVARKREDEYQEKLQSIKDSFKKGGFFTEKALQDKAIKKFNERFYAQEISMTNEFNRKAKRRKELVLKELDGSLSKREKNELNRIAPIVDAGEQAYIVAKYFEPRRIEKLRSDYPYVMTELKNEIIKHQPKGDYGSLAEHKAVVECFKNKFPDVSKELKDKANSKRNDVFNTECALAAGAIIDSFRLVANPKGFVIAKGIRGLLNSKAMSGFTKNVGGHIDRALTTAGVNTQSKSYRKVVNGVGIATVAAITVLTTDVELGYELLNMFTDDASAQSPTELSDSVDVDIGAQAPTHNDTPHTPIDIMLAKHVEQSSEVSGDFFVDSELDRLQNPMDANEVQHNQAQDEIESKAEPNPTETENTLETPSASSEQDIQSPSIDEEEAKLEELLNDIAPIENIDTDTVKDISIDAEGNYVVVQGDTLSEIVERMLVQNQISYDYQLIDQVVENVTEANNLTSPDMIIEGQSLNLINLEQMGLNINAEASVNNSIDDTPSLEHHMNLGMSQNIQSQPIIEKAHFRHRP